MTQFYHFKQSEHQLQTEIMQYLKLHKFYVMRLNSGKIPQRDSYGKLRMISLSPVGTPDLMAIKNGKAYFIEVKIKPNKPTRLQELKMAELKDYGAEVFVAYSLSDVLERLG